MKWGSYSFIVTKYFWDTNLWVYLNTRSQDANDRIKRKKLETLLLSIGDICISTQVLNELANVLLKKYGHSEAGTKIRIEQICQQTKVVFLTAELTLKALDLKTRYQFGWYDSLIVATALDAECKWLYTEDFQNGLLIEERLKVVNPFDN